jgi:hypothetical protein
MPSDSDAIASAASGPVLTWRTSAVALIVFAVLSIVHTWPLATDPAHLSRNDTGDALLNEWIVSWVAHQALRDPLNLFHANIFYPASNTLAFSEPLIVPGLMGAPVRWLGGSPVLTYNLLLLAGFTLTAFAMYFFIASVTRSHTAGFLAGSILSFNTNTLTRLPHLQIIHAEWVPLALWAFDRLLTGSRTRDALWLALFVVLVALTSGYLAIFLAVALLVGFVARAREWWGPRTPPILGRLALAGALSLAVALPVLWPYREMRREQGFARTIGSIANYSASPYAYLTTTSRLHFDAWSGELYRRKGHEKYFPGFVTYALAAVALWRGRRIVGGPRVAMLAAIAAAGFILSLGVNTPLYEPLHRLIPPLQGLRAVSRFGYLFILAAAALAGIGLVCLRSMVGSRRAWLSLAIAAIALVNVENLHAPFRFQPFVGVSAVYDVLPRERGDVVVAEFPLYAPQAGFMNAQYVFNSAWHWQKLVNGYSGYQPASYRYLARRVQDFPAEDALELLRKTGVTHIVVHPRRYSRQRRALVLERVSASAALVKIAEDEDGVALYRLR